MAPPGRQPKAAWALAAGMAAVEAGLYLTLSRPKLRRWGATAAEQVRPLPGDELSEGRIRTTQAITIDAAPSAVWPWLSQIGQGRGGFYTHTWVENVLGARIRNAERIMPEFQDLRVGDMVRTYWDIPGVAALAWQVRAVAPNQYLVLDWRGNGTSGWTLFLEPRGSGQTRVLSRWHERPPSAWSRPLDLLVTEPLHLYQATGVLSGLKERAERKAADSSGVPS